MSVGSGAENRAHWIFRCATSGGSRSKADCNQVTWSVAEPAEPWASIPTIVWCDDKNLCSAAKEAEVMAVWPWGRGYGSVAVGRVAVWTVVDVGDGVEG